MTKEKKKKPSKKSSSTKGAALLPEVVDAEPSSNEKGLTTTDPLALYLNEVRKYPMLTPEEEREVAIRYYETKDPKAAEILVTSNLRFVVKVAAEYSKFGAKLIDLVQEGNVGLMNAVKEFNPYKGVRLITYAVWWIRGYIQEFLMRQFSMVRIGTTQNQRKLFYKLQQERKKLEAMGQSTDIKLLSSKLGISEEEIQDMQKRMNQRDVSLDQPMDDDGKTILADYQAIDTTESADKQIEHIEDMSALREKVDEVKKELNEKELYILEHRLLSETPQTLQEIGDKYRMTRERTRQLEARIIDKLKKAYADEA